MRSLILVLLALLALAPAAAALHPAPTPEERLREGADLSVHVIFTGGASAGGAAEKDGRNDEGFGSVYRDEHAWSSSWDWTATGHLGGAEEGREGTVALDGNASITVRTSGRRETTSERGGESGPETQKTTSETVTTCTARGPVGGLGRGSFRLEGNDIVLRLPAPGAAPQGRACRVSIEETDTHGSPRSRSEDTNPLYDVAFSTKVDEDDVVELRVPASAGKTILTGAHDATLPAGNDALAGRLCGRVYPQTEMVATCRARETIEVRLFAGICETTEDRAARHAAELTAAVGRAPAGGAEAALFAWSDDVAARIRTLLEDERAHILAGCTPEMQGNMEAVVNAAAAVRDALGKAAKEGKLTQEGERRLLGAERSTQLLGGPEAAGDAATGLQQVLGRAAGVSGQGDAGVRVHSPVALRALTPEGRVVGWNATSNASEAGVEGAAAEGVPGGAQSLTLPPGVYFLEIAEQEFAEFILILEGPDGEEAHLMRALPGRVTRIPIALADDGDGTKLHVYAPTRSGATTPGPSVAEGPDAAEGDENGTPAGWVALVALAVAGAALLRRR